MTISLHSLRRRTIVAAAGTVVALAASGGATAAFASSGDTAATTASSSCTVHLGAVLRGGTPGALRKDLKALRAAPKADRAAARAAIRTKELNGTYGARVERLAQIAAGEHAGKGHGWAASLPAALKTDLKALRALAPKSADRKAKAQEIVQKAVAGDYGTTIQTRAKAVQARVQARCAAKG